MCGWFHTRGTVGLISLDWVSQIWLSKTGFTWLIVISHRYVLYFTLMDQLTHSISHDDAIACHWFICYWLLSLVTHDYEPHDVWLSHMTHSYESWVSRMWSTLDAWLVLWVMIDLGMLRKLTHASQLMDFILWLTMSHESRNARVWVTVEGRTPI